MADEQKILDQIRKQIRAFPDSCGLYFMKDSSARVLYIGKAKHLRNRAGSYFQSGADLAASRGPKIVEMISHVCAVDYLETKNEVEAMLHEARLIKDIRPPYNSDLTDDKTFPYLEIDMSCDFPPVYITRQPHSTGTKLFGPFTNVRDLRNVLVVLQKIFKFRTCKLDICAGDDKLRFFRPCLLYSIKQCRGPCSGKIDKTTYRKIIRDLVRFLNSKRAVVLRSLKKQMQRASDAMDYESAKVYRDRIRLIKNLSLRGDPDLHVQPEVFAVDPIASLETLQNALGITNQVRIIEGIDVAHFCGEAAVGSVVKFIDGRPFKQGYRRFKIKTVAGIDDYAMIAEVVRRRYKQAVSGEELWPDIVLIDGGVGQLHAAQKAFQDISKTVPELISISKKEELIHRLATKKPLKLSRTNLGLKLLQYVRDEAHRFAQHYHHILTGKKLFDK